LNAFANPAVGCDGLNQAAKLYGNVVLAYKVRSRSNPLVISANKTSQRGHKGKKCSAVAQLLNPHSLYPL
jgi:hypothetical protein